MCLRSDQLLRCYWSTASFGTVDGTRARLPLVPWARDVVSVRSMKYNNFVTEHFVSIILPLGFSFTALEVFFFFFLLRRNCCQVSGIFIWRGRSQIR